MRSARCRNNWLCPQSVLLLAYIFCEREWRANLSFGIAEVASALVETEQTRSLLEGMGFPDVSEDLLRERELLTRVDTKFVFELSKLEPLLRGLVGDYQLLRAGGEAVAQYRTLYFDTADFRYLRAHHRGRRPRYKVRIRHYLERELSMLEVKKKTNGNKTEKVRKPLSFNSEGLTEEDLAFIDSFNPVHSSELHPILRTDFSRISLVGVHAEERVTFDVHLNFRGQEEGVTLSGGVIAELKQARFMPGSGAVLALRELGIRPCSVSKVCTAAMLLLPEVRLNRLRPSLRSLKAVCHA